MSTTRREAWLCVLQDAHGIEEKEPVTIERDGDRAPPVIELTAPAPSRRR